MIRTLVLGLVAAGTLVFGGCGLAETGASAAVGGVSKAEEVKQAKETEARVQQQIDAATRQAAQQRSAAEAAAQ